MLKQMKEDIKMEMFWECRRKSDFHEKMFGFYRHRAEISRNPKTAIRLHKRADMERDASMHYCNLSGKIFYGFEEEASV